MKQKRTRKLARMFHQVTGNKHIREITPLYPSHFHPVFCVSASSLLYLESDFLVSCWCFFSPKLSPNVRAVEINSFFMDIHPFVSLLHLSTGMIASDCHDLDICLLGIGSKLYLFPFCASLGLHFTLKKKSLLSKFNMLFKCIITGHSVNNEFWFLIAGTLQICFQWCNKHDNLDHWDVLLIAFITYTEGL